MTPTDKNEISFRISSLDSHKSSGPNSIPVKILKLLKNDISQQLSDIFNMSFSTGQFPSVLKIAKVIPIHKKQSKVDYTNYRPISLLSNIENIIEKLMYKVLVDEIKIKLTGKSLYPPNSIKYLGIKIDRFLHWQDQVNSIAVKLNRANALLLKIRNYVNMKTLRNIYFAMFDSHLSYSCIVWAQTINTVRRLVILQKRALRIMSFKDQLFHSSPLFSSNNILTLGDKITLENILFVSKSINRQVPSICYDWFTFSGNLHRYETCWSVTNHLNIPTFRTQKYGHFSIRTSAIRSWN